MSRPRRRRPLPRLARLVADHELWFLAAAAPFLLFPNRWTAIAFLLIPLTWLARWVSTGRFTVRTSLDLPIAILGVMAVVGYAISVDPAMSRAKFWGIVLQIALTYGMANSLRDERGLVRMVGLFLAATMVVALVSLVGTDWGSVRLLDVPRIYDAIPTLIRDVPGSGLPGYGSLFHPREIGGTMAMVLPVPVALAAFGRDRRLRWLSLAALILAGPMLLLAQSGQALFGFLLGLLFIAVWWSPWFLLAVPLGAAAVGAAVVVAGPREVAIGLLSYGHPIGVGVVLRIDMWSRALAMIRDMPFTGVGLNTFPIMQSQFYPGYALGPNEPFAHNHFLQTAVDLGVPGLVGFVWLAAAFYATLLRSRRDRLGRDLEVTLVGIGAGLAAYVGNGMLDCVTLGAKPTAALWVMVGIGVAISQLAQRCDETTSEPAAREGDGSGSALGRKRRLFTAGALVGGVVLAGVLAPRTVALNLGTVAAHRAVLDARAAGAGDGRALEQAEAYLRRAVEGDTDNVSALQHLASVQAWRGAGGEALETFAAAVALDARAPLAHYAPWEAWRPRLEGEPQPDPREALLKVYSHWMRRYPTRAEHYVQVALVWEHYRGDAERARQVLESGLASGAEPAGLLVYYLEMLSD